jgi:hypothetical protein
MTPEQQKEEISKAYIHAVVAKCGYKLGTWSQDSGLLDVTIGAAGIVGTGTIAAPKIDLQVKCTSDQTNVHEEFISWELEVAHYEILRAKTAAPHLLVVLVLPEEEPKWIEHAVDQLLLRRCAYWVRLTGHPPVATKTKTVRLPVANVFSPDALAGMMEKLSKGEDI